MKKCIRRLSYKSIESLLNLTTLKNVACVRLCYTQRLNFFLTSGHYDNYDKWDTTFAHNRGIMPTETSS